MTATDEYRAPLADAVPPDLDHTPAMFPIVTGQPARRPARPPVRERLADGLDAALRSPRWDQVRGVVLLACVTVCGLALVAMATVAFLTGAVLLLRAMWEVW